MTIPPSTVDFVFLLFFYRVVASQTRVTFKREREKRERGLKKEKKRERARESEREQERARECV